eukprot:CCRYP_005882-RC/>CCRYP_005882-RC protein AED:0.38 eAED:0.38 QI:198/1/1/1/0/0.5/2/160/628
MSQTGTKKTTMKGETVKRISEIDFSNGTALIQLLGSAGVVKKPGTPLKDLQRATLTMYSPKTLQLYCQYLSPESFIEDDKKADLVTLLLQKLEAPGTVPRSIPTTPTTPPCGKPMIITTSAGKTTNEHLSTITEVTPSKDGVASLSSGAVEYSITDQLPGYSKNATVTQLEKAFKLKKIRRFSREHALYHLLLQTDEGFAILNRENNPDMTTLTKDYIYSKYHCNPSLVGWDIFATENESVVVRDRLMKLLFHASSDSSTSSFRKPKDSSDDSSVEDVNRSTHGSDVENASKYYESMDNDTPVKSDKGFVRCDRSAKTPTGKSPEITADGSCLSGLSTISAEVIKKTGREGAKKRLIMNNETTVPSSIPKLKSFSYDRSKIKKGRKPSKIEAIVSYPMMSYDQSELHVILACLFDKSSFKTTGVQAMLEAAAGTVEDGTTMLDWIMNSFIAKKRKSPYGTNEADLVEPDNMFPKSEILVLPMVLPAGTDSQAVRSYIEQAIEFIVSVLRSETAVSFYQQYVSDQHSRLWDSLVRNAQANKKTPEEYTKHFIEDFATNEPNVSFNVSLDHFLMDDTIRHIVNTMGYLTANDLIKTNFNCKSLYRDAEVTDVPEWMNTSNTPAMKYNFGN